MRHDYLGEETSLNRLNQRYKRKTFVPRKVLPAYTHEEANAILTSVNRETGLGKRDYAILLLAKKTGIRTIDIANLRFDNLDWQNCIC